MATIVNKRWEVIGIYCFLLLTPHLKYKKFFKMYYLKVECYTWKIYIVKHIANTKNNYKIGKTQSNSEDKVKSITNSQYSWRPENRGRRKQHRWNK